MAADAGNLMINNDNAQDLSFGTWVDQSPVYIVALPEEKADSIKSAVLSGNKQSLQSNINDESSFLWAVEIALNEKETDALNSVLQAVKTTKQENCIDYLAKNTQLNQKEGEDYKKVLEILFCYSQHKVFLFNSLIRQYHKDKNTDHYTTLLEYAYASDYKHTLFTHTPLIYAAVEAKINPQSKLSTFYHDFVNSKDDLNVKNSNNPLDVPLHKYIKNATLDEADFKNFHQQAMTKPLYDDLIEKSKAQNDTNDDQLISRFVAAYPNYAVMFAARFVHENDQENLNLVLNAPYHNDHFSYQVAFCAAQYAIRSRQIALFNTLMMHHGYAIRIKYFHELKAVISGQQLIASEEAKETLSSFSELIYCKNTQSKESETTTFLFYKEAAIFSPIKSMRAFIQQSDEKDIPSFNRMLRGLLHVDNTEKLMRFNAAVKECYERKAYQKLQCLYNYAKKYNQPKLLTVTWFEYEIRYSQPDPWAAVLSGISQYDQSYLNIVSSQGKFFDAVKQTANIQSHLLPQFVQGNPDVLTHGALTRCAKANDPDTAKRIIAIWPERFRSRYIYFVLREKVESTWEDGNTDFINSLLNNPALSRPFLRSDNHALLKIASRKRAQDLLANNPSPGRELSVLLNVYQSQNISIPEKVSGEISESSKAIWEKSRQWYQTYSCYVCIAIIAGAGIGIGLGLGGINLLESVDKVPDEKQHPELMAAAVALVSALFIACIGCSWVHHKRNEILTFKANETTQKPNASTLPPSSSQQSTV